MNETQIGETMKMPCNTNNYAQNPTKKKEKYEGGKKGCVSFCSKNSEESLETAYLQRILLLAHSAQAHTSQLHARGQKATASKFSSSHNFTTSSQFRPWTPVEEASPSEPILSPRN